MRKEGRRRGAPMAAWLALAGLGACGGGGDGAGANPTAPPVPLSAQAGHVLRRLAYGPTPDLLERLSREGVEPWIEEQLWPESVPESPRLLALLAQLPAPQSEADAPTLAELVDVQIARALFSERQLREQLVDFWETHFNTNFFKLNARFGATEPAAWLEWRENARFRELALARFEDLLVASATSPAMLVSLDNMNNVAAQPNENYARELLELQTFGVDSGYTQADIEELARCFTGWTLCQVPPGHQDDPHAPCGGAPGSEVWAFHFDPSQHDTGAKLLFPGTPHELYLPARSGAAGIDDGYEVLRHLASLPRTARFVCAKLLRRFVSDDPPPELLDECVATWLATGGDVREVLRAIVSSPDFLGEEHRWSKVETPFESLCSTARAIAASAHHPRQFVQLRTRLEGPKLGHQLFRWMTPDGFPEGGEELVSTAAIVGRIEFNQGVYTEDEFHVHYDPVGLLLSRGVDIEDPEAVADELLRLFFQENVSASDRELALAFAETDANGEPAPLIVQSPDFELRLRQLVCFIASLPQGMQQ